MDYVGFFQKFKQMLEAFRCFRAFKLPNSLEFELLVLCDGRPMQLSRMWVIVMVPILQKRHWPEESVLMGQSGVSWIFERSLLGISQVFIVLGIIRYIDMIRWCYRLRCKGDALLMLLVVSLIMIAFKYLFISVRLKFGVDIKGIRCLRCQCDWGPIEF